MKSLTHIREEAMKHLVIAVLVMGAAQVSAAVSESQPNILFIVSDDHGWGDLPSNWDKTEVQMPVLGKLAAGGVRFSNYHTVSLCGPSRACMFTGQYTSENGMWRGPGKQPLGSPGYRGIKRDVRMLSEYLAEAGYATGAFGKWHMGEHPGELPNDRGVDEFRGFLGGTHGYWVTKKRTKILHNGKPDDSEGHTTELFTKWSEAFIRENAARKKPFFCYLAYNAVHGPIRTDKSKPASAPEAWVKKALGRGVSFLRSDYVAVLEHMDHNIGQLVKLLNELGIAENTLIVFVSDNGACRMNDGMAGNYPGNNGPFRGSKATTYQGGLSVPFLMNWKGRLPKGTVSAGQVMHCDIFATLLDAADVPLPKMNGKNPMRGMSLMPHMLSGGKKAVPERTMIFELWGNIGLRKGDYKLWSDVGREHSPDWAALATELERTDLKLFDLGKDVAEQNDLRSQHPEIYATLKKELIDHFANVNAVYPTAATHPALFAGGTTEKQPKGTKVVRKKAIPKTAAAARPRGGKSNAFAAMDKNGDGKASVKELDAWLKARAEKHPDKLTYKPNQAKGALAKRDKNKDGVLSEEEWNNDSRQGSERNAKK